jgi:hypothetical protein
VRLFWVVAGLLHTWMLRVTTTNRLRTIVHVYPRTMLLLRHVRPNECSWRQTRALWIRRMGILTAETTTSPLGTADRCDLSQHRADRLLTAAPVSLERLHLCCKGSR